MEANFIAYKKQTNECVKYSEKVNPTTMETQNLKISLTTGNSGKLSNQSLQIQFKLTNQLL